MKHFCAIFLLKNFLICSFLGLMVWESTNAESLNNYNSKCFSSDDGLPQNSVTDILIADDGQMVISTFLGSVTFDGHRFSDFLPQSDLKYPKAESYYLEKGLVGDIFIGTTTNGLYRYHNNEIKHWDITNGLSNNNVLKIVVTQQGVYFNNRFNLVFINNKYTDAIEKIEIPKELNNSNYYLFKINSKLAIANRKTTWFYTDNNWHEYPIFYNNQELNGEIIQAKNNDSFFFIKHDNRLFKIKNNQAELLINDLKMDESIIINSVLLDKQQQLWFATENHGLIRYQGEKSETLLETKHHRTASFIEDDEGVIWFGGSSGLCFLKANAIRNIGQLQGLEKDNIRYLSVDAKDTVYAINQDAQKGYYSITKDAITYNHFQPSHDIANEMVYALIKDGQNIWISTRKRIAKINGSQTTTLLKTNSPSRSLLTKNGTLWFSDRSFLYKHNKSGIKKYFIAKDIDVYAMDFALNGDVLLAERENAYRLHNEQIKKIDLPLNLSTCIHEFNNNELWVCSEGLWLKKNGMNYYFDEKNGFTHGHVHDAIMDKKGDVWAITNTGLFRIKRKAIEQLNPDTYKNKVLFTRYTEKDGMQSSEFNGSSNANVTTSDGKLWFASQKGIVVVDPDFKDRSRNKILTPFVEHLFIGDDRIPQNQWLAIRPNPQSIHFHFSSVLLSGSNNITYRYKLINYHTKWQTGSSANFSNLSPNSYKLLAQVRLYDNPWSNPIEVRFNIKPAWYQTLLFRIIAFIITIMILIGLPLWRIQWLKKSAIALQNQVDKQTQSLMKANKKLAKLAQIDELTNIANRREFFNQLSEICRQNTQNVHLALIDVDDFKAYNDFYGHIAGDECLKTVAAIMNDFSSKNCLVARFGGEEFVMLFTQMNGEQAKRICLQLLENLTKKAIIHEKSSVKNTISISVGLVACKKDETVEQFIERADDAMYKAKTSGKDCLITQ